MPPHFTPLSVAAEQVAVEVPVVISTEAGGTSFKPVSI